MSDTIDILEILEKNGPMISRDKIAQMTGKTEDEVNAIIAGLEKEKEEKAQSNVPVQKPERVPMPNDYLEKLKDYATNSSHTQKENEVSNQPPKSFVPQNTGNSGFLGDFNMDEDKALLLSLIMLLSEEKGDELLIMALIYMLT